MFCFSKKIFYFFIISIFIIFLFFTTYYINKNNQQTQAQALSVNPIVGGNNADPNEWPFMVFIYDKKYLDSHHVELPSFTDEIYISQAAIGGAFCSGTIISKDWILTAAHCLYNFETKRIYDPLKKKYVLKKILKSIKSPSEIGIAVGFTNSHEKILKDNWNDRFIEVENFFPYDNFEFNYSHNLNYIDIGLIKLKRPINYSSISLSNKFALTLPEKAIEILGWGTKSTSFFNIAPSTILQEAKLIINEIDTETAAAIKTYHDYFISNNELNEGSSCMGDSGGPAISYDNNKWVQTGIISGGDQDCTVSVFTNLTSKNFWIKKITGIDINQGTFIGKPH